MKYKARTQQHGEKKTENLNLSFTPEGKKAFIEQAAHYGLSPSEYAERLGRRKIKLTPRQEKQLMGELFASCSKVA